MAKGGLRAAFFCLLAGLALPALPHGDHDPKHGGIIGRSNDEVIVELTIEDGVAVLYLHDEQEKPIPAQTVKGTLTLVPAQRPRQSVPLVPAGGNKLTAPGLKPVSGDNLRAYFTLPNGDVVTSAFLFSR
ncbi:MAG TPA: hypothetical protein VHG88_15100 [Burkholderiales bacterium]|nr:hypothetical protein [Burkholderiales bacterium]